MIAFFNINGSIESHHPLNVIPSTSKMLCTCSLFTKAAFTLYLFTMRETSCDDMACMIGLS